MTNQQSLGEQKTANCAWCQTPFSKTRYDQRFCCKACAVKLSNREQWKKGRKDREKQNLRRMERYYASRDAELQKHRERRAANPEKYRQIDRAKYQRNKEKHAARVKMYREAHPQKRALEYRARRERYPWQECLANARNRSSKKRLPFDLTREWCLEKWTGFCALTGLPFSFGTQTHFPFSPSVDRIDSTKGYVQSNCRFVLFAVNSFKGTGTDEDMLRIAKALIDQNAAPPIL